MDEIKNTVPSPKQEQKQTEIPPVYPMPEEKKKTPEEELNLFLKNSRYLLILLGVFSALNMWLLVITDFYFPPAAAVPYYITILSYFVIDGGFFGSASQIAVVIGLIISGLYVLCGVMVKKSPVWNLIATILYGVDTLLLVAMNVYFLGSVFPDISSTLVEYLFHIAIFCYTLVGWMRHKQMRAAVETPHAGAQILKSTNPEVF